MNEQPALSRRTDRLAVAATVGSGLSAQAAMWVSDRRTMYLIAAGLFVGVAAINAWRLLSSRAITAATRRLTNAANLLACAALLIVCVMSGAFTGVAGGGRPTSKTVAVAAMLLVAQLVQTALVANRRDLALSAPVVGAMLTDAGMAAHDATPAVPFAVSLVCLVAALVFVHRGDQLASAHSSFTRRRFASLASPARALGRVGVVVVVAFVALPNSFHLGVRPAPQHHADVRSRTQALPADEPGARSEAIADPASGSLDLRVRGELGDAPVFVVSADSPPYWRGSVYDNYDGTRWTITGTALTTSWEVVSSEQKNPKDEAVHGETRTDAVRIVSTRPLRVVFAPGTAIAYTGAGAVSSDVDGNPRLATGDPGPASSRDYDVVSTRPLPDNETLSAVPARSDEPTDSRWTQLPPRVPARVKALATQLAAGASSRAAVVTAVDEYLRAHEVYDLNSPLPASGDDAVDDFLFVSHRGFCEQFATTAAVLLRSAGIPTRLVTGYSHGDLSAEPGKRLMRAADAHAWIQVWYPGIGWIDNDPTANAQPASPSTAAAPASAAPSALPKPSAHTPASMGSLHGATQRIPGGRFTILGAIAALVLVVRLAAFLPRWWPVRRLLRRWLSRHWLSRRRLSGRRLLRREPRAAAPGGPVLRAYSRLDAMLADAGYDRLAGETPRERLRRVSEIRFISDDVQRALELLERECYGVEPLLPEEAAFASSIFNAFTNNALSAPITV